MDLKSADIQVAIVGMGAEMTLISTDYTYLLPLNCLIVSKSFFGIWALIGRRVQSVGERAWSYASCTAGSPADIGKGTTLGAASAGMPIIML